MSNYSLTTSNSMHMSVPVCCMHAMVAGLVVIILASTIWLKIGLGHKTCMAEMGLIHQPPKIKVRLRC